MTIPDAAFTHRAEFYRDGRGDWRWRVFSLRGNLPDLVVANGGQGYNNRDDMLAAFVAMVGTNPEGGSRIPIEYVDGEA